VANTDGAAESVLQQLQQAGCPMSCTQMQQLITQVRLRRGACVRAVRAGRCVGARARVRETVQTLERARVSDSHPRPAPAPALRAQLQSQDGTVQNTVATFDAGGAPVPANNPNWAPWPAHAWPNSQTTNGQLLAKTVNAVQSTDSTEIDDIWGKMHAAGC
jgi:hypothetical protein